MNIWGVWFLIEFEFNVFKALFIGRMHYPNLLSRAIQWSVCLVWIWGVNKLKWICQIVMHQVCLMPRFGFWKYGRKLFIHQRIQEKGFWLQNKIQQTTRHFYEYICWSVTKTYSMGSTKFLLNSMNLDLNLQCSPCNYLKEETNNQTIALTRIANSFYSESGVCKSHL